MQGGPAVPSPITVAKHGEVTRVGFVHRNILEESLISRIGDELARMIFEMVTPKILISFTGVEHMSSAALGTLITVSSQIRKKDGQLRLASIDPVIYEVFLITKLNQLFQIHPNDDEALKSFKK